MAVPFTFIHAADLHLDSPFKGLSGVPETVRKRLRESTFAALRSLADIATREGADFVVIAGDLYDAADRSLKAQLRLQSIFSELTAQGIGVFAVHGNHDPENGRGAKLDWPSGVHIFGTTGVECSPAYRRSGELAAHVYGISYPVSAVTDNLALRFAVREGAPFHLAVLHANVDGDPAHDNYAPCRLGELTSAGFHYWALGHVHDRRVLHEYPHVVYSGNIQGRNVRETGAKGVYAVRVSETGAVSMAFRETSDVRWMESAVSIEGAEREQQLKERLLQSAEDARKRSEGRPVVLRLRLEGRGALHDSLLREGTAEQWLDELREWLGPPDEREDWVWADSLVVRTAGIADLEALSREDGFVGELVRRGLRAANDPDLSLKLLEEELQELRKLPRIREWLASRSDGERSEWTRRALETALSMLQEHDAG